MLKVTFTRFWSGKTTTFTTYSETIHVINRCGRTLLEFYGNNCRHYINPNCDIIHELVRIPYEKKGEEGN